MARYWDHFRSFAPSRPRAARGGIRMQSKRGATETWWAKRWIDVLESFNMGARLSRGRSYARKGQVLSIGVEKGKVLATVQGSRPSPYRVRIEIKPLSAADWKKLTGVISSQAVFAAKLLGGEMPHEIEELFRKENLPLFPTNMSQIETDCSCPDWANPCKHIAAVYYLLGDEFDRDPFLIFRLRGMERDELAQALGQSETRATAPEVAEEPLPSTVAEFWGRREKPDRLTFAGSRPAVDGAVLRGLGKFPFWTGEEGLVESLAPLYRVVSDAADGAAS